MQPAKHARSDGPFTGLECSHKRSRHATPGEERENEQTEILEAQATLSQLTARANASFVFVHYVRQNYPIIMANPEFSTSYTKVNVIYMECQNLNARFSTQTEAVARDILAAREAIIRDYLWLGTLEISTVALISQFDR